MDEFVDIVDNHQNFLYAISKNEAHRKGLPHRSIHLWLYNAEGQILIQKRSANKMCYPNLWDVSVAGHLSSKEDPIQAALRECKEEIGLELQAQDLYFYGTNHKHKVHRPNFIDLEYQQLFLAELRCPLGDLVLQTDEVSEVRLIDFDTLFDQWESGNPNYVPRNHIYRDLLLKNLILKLRP
jgi:isopentenyldiphosphate isomerase